MAKLFNRAKMDTSTTGSGTITLGSAVDGYQSFADAGVADSDVVQYVIEDGTSWEIGTGTYSATGTSLTRTPSESSNAGAAISLTGAAEVFISAIHSDFERLQNAGTTKVEATSTGATVTGNLAVTGTVDGRDVASDGSKLDGIESGATADQTASEILTAIKTVDGSGSGLDADTLDSYHATDFVGAAGDTMTGDLLVQSDIKATGQIRATGWWNTNTGTTGSGLATEIGVSGGESYILSYNRDNATYGDLNFAAVNINFDERGGTTTIENNEIWHAGNDGSGSGLDADKLDGVQGSSFLRSDANDTASGAITFTNANGIYFNDTNTQILEGAGNSVKVQTNTGYLELGPRNTGYCHFYTDRSQFYFDKQTIVNGNVYPYTDSARTLGTSANRWSHIYGDAATIGGSIAIGGTVTLQESTDRADLLQITSSTSGWGGLQIRNSSNEGRWSFMTDGSAAGIYDDENGDWHIYMTENAGPEFRYNGVTKMTIGATYTEMAQHLDMNNYDIYGVDQIYHHGDTNTYIQFHASDQFRVVTGGVERLEVNNTRTQIDNLEVTGSATFSGTVTGAGGASVARGAADSGTVSTGIANALVYGIGITSNGTAIGYTNFTTDSSGNFTYTAYYGGEYLRWIAVK